MKILKFNENFYEGDYDDYLKQKVELKVVEDVLIESLQSGDIDMIHVNIGQLIDRIAEYPKYSKTIKKYNLR